MVTQIIQYSDFPHRDAEQIFGLPDFTGPNNICFILPFKDEKMRTKMWRQLVKEYKHLHRTTTVSPTFCKLGNTYIGGEEGELHDSYRSNRWANCCLTLTFHPKHTTKANQKRQSLVHKLWGIQEKYRDEKEVIWYIPPLEFRQSFKNMKAMHGGRPVPQQSGTRRNRGHKKMDKDKKNAIDNFLMNLKWQSGTKDLCIKCNTPLLIVRASTKDVEKGILHLSFALGLERHAITEQFIRRKTREKTPANDEKTAESHEEKMRLLVEYFGINRR